MRVFSFYHCFAAGEWRDPAVEYLAALKRSKFRGPLVLGLVGPPEARQEALSLFQEHRKPIGCIEAEGGAEQVTLSALREFALMPEARGAAILYAHSKGAYMPTGFNILWRRSMTKHVVEGWANCVEKLKGRDAVGCHWLTRVDFPEHAAAMADGFFGGNFWMAAADYLATLPQLRTEDRWKAESWIGEATEKPKIYDLLEGWPSVEAFRRGGTI